MVRSVAADGVLEAVRGLWLADPDLGVKPLLAKLREQQPELGAATKEAVSYTHLTLPTTAIV